MMLTLPNPYHMFFCAISVVSRDYPCHRLVADRQLGPRRRPAGLPTWRNRQFRLNNLQT